MSNIRCWLSACLAGQVMLLATAEAPANAATATFDFTNKITNNSPYVGSQLSVTVSDAGVNLSGQNLVSFTFKNQGPPDSSITDIYFYFANDPPSLALPPTVTNGSGVLF